MSGRGIGVVLALALVAGVSVSSAAAQVTTTGAPATGDTRGLFTIQQVPNLKFTAFNARPFTDAYGASYAATCPAATQLQALQADGTDVGLGSTFGDATGKTVGRYKIVRYTTPKSARKLFQLVKTDPVCAAVVAGPAIAGVLTQYPVPPAPPTLGTPITTDDLVSVPFSGTSTIGNFEGQFYVATAGDVITTTAIRIATPVAGQVGAIDPVIAPVILYDTALAGSPAPTETMNLAVDNYARVRQADFTAYLSSKYPDAAVQPAARTTVATFPAECPSFSDAFTYSGAKASVGGFTAQASGGKLQVRTELFAFANEQQAKDYVNHFNNVTECIGALFPAPTGTQASGGLVSTPKAGIAFGAKNTCGLRIYGAWAPAGASTPALSRAFGVGNWGRHAAFFTMQMTDGSVRDIGSTLCKQLAAGVKEGK